MNPDAEKLKAMNSWDNKTRAFGQITQMLRKTTDPDDAWRKVLEITEQSDIPLFRAAYPLPDIEAASAALGALFASKPPPHRLSFFYFGLLDLWNEREQKEEAGLYIVGGVGADLDSGKICYTPQERWLSMALLNTIKEAERQVPERREILDYAVMFGGGGVIAKFALAALHVKRPVYVGFDSGDHERISN